MFCDVDADTLSLSPDALRTFLDAHAELNNGVCRNRETGRRIRACVVVHVFGFPARVDDIVRICEDYDIDVIEDAAESLGSSRDGRHTGTTGRSGVLSFNGNKVITTGGGGMILTEDAGLAAKARHLTTTAKVRHPWDYRHDCVGYNYRMPNVNAALGCAQLECLDEYLTEKRQLAAKYDDWCEAHDVKMIKPPPDTTCNHWLNCILLENEEERDEFLKVTNDNGVMTRPPGYRCTNWRCTPNAAAATCRPRKTLHADW